MKRKQVIGNQEKVDVILQEMSQLYRDRLRALYNQDLPMLQTINQKIDTLKAKLTPL